MLIRSWNLFNGNTVPPGRRAYLREMIELVTVDRPDVVCLQEVPGWALGRLDDWAGMTALTVQTKRSTLGPLPLPATIGRALTAPHHGIIRSAFAGQGNAILLAPGLQARTYETKTFGYGWGGQEPRAAQRADLGHVVVANVHCSRHVHGPAEIASILEWLRAARPLVLAGDFNTTPEGSPAVASFPGAILGSIDQVLVRGALVSTRVWLEEERRHGDRLLSDHAPVEATIRL